MSRKFRPVIIDEIRHETADAYSVYFQNPDPEVFTYQPGQYLTIRLTIDGEEYRRCFSLSSAPGQDERLSVTIKRVENGRVSNYMIDHLREGDIVEIMPPMGNFCVSLHPEQARHYVLIGAGSGITPLMSILKSVLATEPESRVSLWYGNRTEDAIIFRKELSELARMYGERLDLHHTLSQPGEEWTGFSGRLDKQKIYDLTSEIFMNSDLRKLYYLCGPDGMIAEALAAFDQHAVNPSDIHREIYTLSAPDEEPEGEMEEDAGQDGILFDGEESYSLQKQQVTIIMDGESHIVEVEPDSVILEAAIQARMDPPFACQSGICTTCRAMLYSGVVSMDETEGLSDDELQSGFILTCQAHPLSVGVEIEYK